MLTSHSTARDWVHEIQVWNDVDASPIELSRACIPGTKIDDTVITAFFGTQFSDRLTILPVIFISCTSHLRVPTEFLFTIHTPCIGIIVPVGGETNGEDANHYVLCVVDRDFQQCRLYNSLQGYNDRATATHLLQWLSYGHYAIFTGLSPMQLPNDCGLWVIRNAMFEMVGHRRNVMRCDVVMHVCYANGISYSSLPTPADVRRFDSVIKLRHIQARADVNEASANISASHGLQRHVS